MGTLGNKIMEVFSSIVTTPAREAAGREAPPPPGMLKPGIPPPEEAP